MIMLMPVSSFPSDPPSSEFISAALRSQLLASPIEISFSHSVTTIPDRVAYFRYIRVENEQLLEGKDPDNDARVSRIWFDKDKKLAKYFYPDDESDTLRGIIDSKKGNTLLAFADLPDPIRYNFPAGELIDLIGLGVVSETMEVIDGKDCWRVQIIPPANPGVDDDKYIVWLDPSIGFCPRRIEAQVTSERTNVAKLTDYQSLGSGIWYPMTVQWDLINNGEVSSSTNVKVNKADLVVESDLPNLEVKFPSGTEVEDLIHNATYVEP